MPGRELILRHSKRVVFRPTDKIGSQVLVAKHELRLESELKKTDRYEVLSSEPSRQYHLQTRFKSSNIRKLTGTRKRVIKVEKRIP